MFMHKILIIALAMWYDFGYQLLPDYINCFWFISHVKSVIDLSDISVIEALWAYCEYDMKNAMLLSVMILYSIVFKVLVFLMITYFQDKKNICWWLSKCKFSLHPNSAVFIHELPILSLHSDHWELKVIKDNWLHCGMNYLVFWLGFFMMFLF